MIVRIIIVLICVSFFINGCNSLISQFFGTHKLRSFAVEQAVRDGIGDSDYVQLEGAYLANNFVYQESEYPNTPPIIIYPVLTDEQAAQHKAGQQVKPAFIAWSADFHSPCVDSLNCLQEGAQNVTGVVRDIPKDRLQGLEKLEAKGFAITEEAQVINHGQDPVPWYWNLMMMLGAAALAVGMEALYFKRQR